MSRPYTEEEVRERFLAHVRHLIDYWERETRRPETREKLEGLAFSILTALDGCTGDLPKFIVAPDPHPDDKEFCEMMGDNHYPENYTLPVEADISGCLHELFYRKQ